MTYVPTTHRVGVTNPQSQGRAGGTHTSGPALVATNESATEAGTGVGLETDLLLGLTTSLRSVTRLGPPYIKDSLSRLRITFAFDSLLELETLCCSATTEILALSIAYHISYSRDFDLRTHHTPSRCHKSTIPMVGNVMSKKGDKLPKRQVTNAL